MNSNSQPNPYAPPTAAVGDSVDNDATLVSAERGTRLGAAMLDGVILMLIYIPFLIGFTSGSAPDLKQLVFGSAGAITLVLFLAWAAYTSYLVNLNGQTIAKKLLGIKVVRSDGARASLGRIFWMRNVVNMLPSIIPFVGYFYGLVDALFIFSEKRQCLHDKIADTIVVRA